MGRFVFINCVNSLKRITTFPPKALKITPPAKKRRKLPIELKISLARVGVLNLGNKLDF